MRAIDSAVSLSRMIKKPLHVLWYTDRTFNCNFDKLFLLPPEIERLEQISLSTLTGQIRSKMTRLLAPAFYDKYCDNDKVLTP